MCPCHRKRRRHAESNVLSVEGITDKIPRIHCSEISAAEFRSKFEALKIPVIVTGLCDSWKARENWIEEKLLQSYSEHRFKVQDVDRGDILSSCIMCLQPCIKEIRDN